MWLSRNFINMCEVLSIPQCRNKNLLFYSVFYSCFGVKTKLNRHFSFLKIMLNNRMYMEKFTASKCMSLGCGSCSLFKSLFQNILTQSKNNHSMKDKKKLITVTLPGS